MSHSDDNALLPAGLTDGLPPDAGLEADVRERLVASFVSRGFDRVSPPLVEFEDHLLAGTGAAMASQTFRLMDPVSQRMMGLRADVTPQVARIATTRLAHEERPLRLCYAGQVLRIRGTQLRPERQFTQAGAELIGDASPRADAEMLLTAAEVLQEIGVTDLSIDLCQPMLVPALMDAWDVSADIEKSIRDALDRKDVADLKSATASLSDDKQSTLVTLLGATGPAEAVTKAVHSLDLGGRAGDAFAALMETVDLIERATPELQITLDVVENRGFEYHTGVTFTLFARGVRGELGSGGRYTAGGSVDDGGEAATGFTLFLDSILRALDTPKTPETVYLPTGTPRSAGQAVRSKGYRTIQGLGDGTPEDDAKRLGCSYILNGDTPEPIE